MENEKPILFQSTDGDSMYLYPRDVLFAIQKLRVLLTENMPDYEREELLSLLEKLKKSIDYKEDIQ